MSTKSCPLPVEQPCGESREYVHHYSQAKPPPKRKEPSPEPPPKAIQRELEKRVQSQRAALKTESSAEVKEEEAAPVKGHMEEMKDVEVSSKPVPKPREANK